MARNYIIEYEPLLIEEAVFLAVRTYPDQARYWRERDQIYEIKDDEQRDDAMQSLNYSWFRTLGLASPLEDLLKEFPLLRSKTQRCIILRAKIPTDMGADLHEITQNFGNEVPKPQIIIQISPEIVANPVNCRKFLVLELLRVNDMLDPKFGYEPDLPDCDFGPAYNHLIRLRYRVVWDTTLYGRLTQRGFMPMSVRDHCWRLFQSYFRATVESIEQSFDYFFTARGITHTDILSFCREPSGGLDRVRTSEVGPCSLCGLPTYGLKPAEQLLSQEGFNIACTENLNWHGALICRQCADLYNATAKHSSPSL